MRNGRHHTKSRFVEDVVRTTRDVVTGALLDTVKEQVRDLLHRSMTSILLHSLVAVAICLGLGMLVASLFYLLRMIPLPEAACYGILGVLTAGGGTVAWLVAGSKRR